MIFESREELNTIIAQSDVKEETVLAHFMEYGDESFYVVEDDDEGSLAGVISPGDVYRYRWRITTDLVNKSFFYVTDRHDTQTAKEWMDRNGKLHEIPVIEKGFFAGLLKNGGRKSADEWNSIRESFFIDEKRMLKEKDEWYLDDMKKLLSLGCKYYIYRNLNYEDMNLTRDGYKVVRGKMEAYGNNANIEGLRALTKRERNLMFGEAHERKMVRNLVWGSRRRDFLYENGIPKYCDWRGAYTIIDGHRIVPNGQDFAKRRIFMVGPCTMFGGYADDANTIESILQSFLNKDEYTDYRVVNLSITGDMSWQQLFREKISSEDIVIIMSYRFNLWQTLESEYQGQLFCMNGMSGIWEDIPYPEYHIYDIAEHCDKHVNLEIAKVMYKDIREVLNMGGYSHVSRRNLQEYYISWDIYNYYKHYFAYYIYQSGAYKNAGVIVMNSNPFTKGHRYLIDEAAKKTDRLFVLVLEEDSSDFSFLDRIDMVRRGTEDIENVTVIPSGDYVISKKTFAQYFDKENVTEIKDMSYDLHVFGKAVAPVLGIHTRFVGQEPYDKVTAAYNETMKRILPEYGIEVVEIDRLMDNYGEAVSASEVRRRLKTGSDRVDEYLPESTIRFLEERYGSITTGNKE